MSISYETTVEYVIKGEIRDEGHENNVDKFEAKLRVLCLEYGLYFNGGAQ